MFILIVFAFLAGIFTVLSPCILPILPVVLSGGMARGGVLSPLGMIIGLISSFTFFTLSLSLLISATGLSPDILRFAAIFLIALFGLVMIFPTLSDLFARIVSPIAGGGSFIQGRSKAQGFWGGFLLGIALGLLWTPCAGPILAAIITLVATQKLDLNIFLITLFYSLGAGIPLFLIAYGGNYILRSSRFLVKYSERIRQFFGFIMILTAVAIAFHWDTRLQQSVVRFFPTFLVEDNQLVKERLTTLKRGNTPLQRYGKAPELTGIVNWINSPPLSLMQLKGKVVLIDFWTYSCINCLRTLPYLEKWYADYQDKGFIVIGVHTPEFEFEKEPKNVMEAAARLGVKYPIAQDNDYKTWEAYENNYWPAHYLIDRQGNLRSFHFGEGGYVETENEIRSLLGLKPEEKEEPSPFKRPMTPETYLGMSRGRSYVGEISLKKDQIVDYHYTPPLQNDTVALNGKWLAENERITSKSDSSFLEGSFLATKVYLVLSGTSSKPVRVFIDGKFDHEFKMDGARKYDIASVPYGRHAISLSIPEGISAYAFTFGVD